MSTVASMDPEFNRTPEWEDAVATKLGWSKRKVKFSTKSALFDVLRKRGIVISSSQRQAAAAARPVASAARKQQPVQQQPSPAQKQPRPSHEEEEEDRPRPKQQRQHQNERYDNPLPPSQPQQLHRAQEVIREAWESAQRSQRMLDNHVAVRDDLEKDDDFNDSDLSLFDRCVTRANAELAQAHARLRRAIQDYAQYCERRHMKETKLWRSQQVDESVWNVWLAQHRQRIHFLSNFRSTAAN